MRDFFKKLVIGVCCIAATVPSCIATEFSQEDRIAYAGALNAEGFEVVYDDEDNGKVAKITAKGDAHMPVILRGVLESAASRDSAAIDELKRWCRFLGKSSFYFLRARSTTAFSLYGLVCEEPNAEGYTEVLVHCGLPVQREDETVFQELEPMGDAGVKCMEVILKNVPEAKEAACREFQGRSFILEACCRADVVTVQTLVLNGVPLVNADGGEDAQREFLERVQTGIQQRQLQRLAVGNIQQLCELFYVHFGLGLVEEFPEGPIKAAYQVLAQRLSEYVLYVRCLGYITQFVAFAGAYELVRYLLIRWSQLNRSIAFMGSLFGVGAALATRAIFTLPSVTRGVDRFLVANRVPLFGELLIAHQTAVHAVV
jgi:hypothetical protein